jgi:hypothetical protein
VRFPFIRNCKLMVMASRPPGPFVSINDAPPVR